MAAQEVGAEKNATEDPALVASAQEDPALVASAQEEKTMFSRGKPTGDGINWWGMWG